MFFLKISTQNCLYKGTVYITILEHTLNNSVHRSFRSEQLGRVELLSFRVNAIYAQNKNVPVLLSIQHFDIIGTKEPKVLIV